MFCIVGVKIFQTRVIFNEDSSSSFIDLFSNWQLISGPKDLFLGSTFLHGFSSNIKRAFYGQNNTAIMLLRSFLELKLLTVEIGQNSSISVDFSSLILAFR